MDWKITLTEMPLNGVGEIRTETMTLHNVDMLGARRIGKMNCKQRGFTCFNMVEVESFVTLKADIRKNLIGRFQEAKQVEKTLKKIRPPEEWQEAPEEEDKHTRI